MGALICLAIMGSPFGFILLLVPVLYSIAVLDLNNAKWEIMKRRET
jgi:hypothetical protein